MVTDRQKQKMETSPPMVVSLVGLTTLQVVWGWVQADLPFNRLSLAAWLFFLILLTGYYLLLHLGTISGLLKRLHYGVVSQITGPLVLGLGLFF